MLSALRQMTRVGAAPQFQAVRMLSTTTETLKGTVKWFDDRKGFGFILPKDGGSDIFVHFSGIKAQDDEYRTLRDDDIVEYKVQVDPINGRQQARDVRKLNTTPRKE
mmetsp:Transcript_10172/g.16725  ORF Transcript_10172/g.16725 Transcript_10172/m.16725 type:complete len:107 (-) Transcript_10172:421-741(-)|eukprot:CAMPEP_0171495860 /NCGR_PEP_ID=MMETSP0958-20121227/6373_1 /TAXON_ID=87120 /ORGANISM="Aurantiochytrium limacinum, Strain ATCCMYA-1381" /LENGTH=106 /DNA_ID=CAMNT_0012029883 /DNA_START=96 /DNA_END=416 /DNA_ORIENTATION=+